MDARGRDRPRIPAVGASPGPAAVSATVSRRRATSWPMAPSSTGWRTRSLPAGGPSRSCSSSVSPRPRTRPAVTVVAEIKSAALLVVREGGGYGGGNDRWIDLRVDQLGRPDRRARPAAGTATPLLRSAQPGRPLSRSTSTAAAEIRGFLTGPGRRPGRSIRHRLSAPMSGAPSADAEPPTLCGRTQGPAVELGRRLAPAPCRIGCPWRTWRNVRPRQAGSILACWTSCDRGPTRD